MLSLALRLKCMEDISLDSLWNYLSGTPKGSTETSGLKEDRKPTPKPEVRVQEKPHRECGEWKSGRDFHKSLNCKAQYCCQEKRKEKVNQIVELLLSNFSLSLLPHLFPSSGCQGCLPLPGFIPPDLVSKNNLQRVHFEGGSVETSQEPPVWFTAASLQREAKELKHLLQFLQFQ